jgi:hypothetical protein
MEITHIVSYNEHSLVKNTVHPERSQQSGINDILNPLTFTFSRGRQQRAEA